MKIILVMIGLLFLAGCSSVPSDSYLIKKSDYMNIHKEAYSAGYYANTDACMKKIDYRRKVASN